jgi:hypothetical protein
VGNNTIISLMILLSIAMIIGPTCTVIVVTLLIAYTVTIVILWISRIVLDCY